MSVSKAKLVGDWLAEAKHFWFALEVIAIALWFSLQPHTTEPVIRIWGLVLQILGILTVAWGISETRALFGHPSVAKAVKAWLMRFPLMRRNVVMSANTGRFGLFGVNGRGYSYFPIDPNADVATRLTALEKNEALTRERITQTQAEMDKRFEEAKAALEEEQKSREAQDDDIRKKLEATGTGGVHISAIGAAWLLVGVILSTVAIEIAEALK